MTERSFGDHDRFLERLQRRPEHHLDHSEGHDRQVHLTIRPGGYDDPAQGWRLCHAAATAAPSTSTPNSPFSKGPYARRKIFTLIGLYSPKGPEWANMGRALIRGILNSARGISDKAISPQAQAARRISGFGDLDGIEFLPASTSARTSTAIRRTRSARRSPRTTGTTLRTWAGPSPSAPAASAPPAAAHAQPEAPASAPTWAR